MAAGEPRLVIYSARWKSAAVVLLGVLFALLFAKVLAGSPTAPQMVAGVVGLLLFGGGAIAVAWRLFRREQLVLTPAGFTIAGHKRWPVIRWADVDEFFVLRTHGSEMAAWRYKPGHEPPPADVLGKLLSGFTPSVGPGWAQSPKRLVATLAEWRDRYGA